MTRILMRAPHSPFVRSRHSLAIARDEINTNAGNLLFPYSISRALMTPGTTIDYVKSMSRANRAAPAPEQVNERYDCLVIPLANAFRHSFAPYLEKLTDYIQSVDVPCIVVGVGLQAKATSKGKGHYRFDDAVRRFMDAALEKSECVGIRGKITATYLANLGYEPERDFTVTGCPSMYLYGADLPEPRPLALNPDSSISLNCKVTLPEQIHRYMSETTSLIPDFHYVVQNTYELASLRYGMDLRETNRKGADLVIPTGYPIGRGNPAVKAGRVIGFTDVPSWLSYLSTKDLSFGTRIHGNIASVLSGTPTFIVAPDSRVLELAQYHRIPHVSMKKIDWSKDIFELVDGIDFSSVLEGHEERFAHYLDFLHRNGLSTVFDDGAPDLPLPFDEKVSLVKPSGPVTMKERITVVDRVLMRHLRRKALRRQPQSRRIQ